MENREIKVTAPEGFHFTGTVTGYDGGHNISITFVKDEPKKITWDDILNYAINSSSFDATTISIANCKCYKNGCGLFPSVINNHNYLIAHNKLMIIAKYFNGDWKPEVNRHGSIAGGYVIEYIPTTYIAENWYSCGLRAGIILFKDKQSCEEAIRIMGDELKYLFNY